jgi:uncharacterized protein YcbX
MLRGDVSYQAQGTRAFRAAFADVIPLVEPTQIRGLMLHMSANVEHTNGSPLNLPVELTDKWAHRAAAERWHLLPIGSAESRRANPT